jgi:carbon storage regulator
MSSMVEQTVDSWRNNVLILSRREAECICLGENIVVTVVSVSADKVRIGIQAPHGVRILRTELDKHVAKPIAGRAAVQPITNLAQFMRRAA